MWPYSLHQGVSQRLDVVAVQVGGGFVQRQDAAVQAEGLGQRQANDQGGQDLSRVAVGPSAVEPTDRRTDKDSDTFWPALQRPLMSSAVSPFTITTR